MPHILNMLNVPAEQQAVHMWLKIPVSVALKLPKLCSAVQLFVGGSWQPMVHGIQS